MVRMLLLAVHGLFVRRRQRHGVVHVHRGRDRAAVRVMVQRGGRALVHVLNELLVMKMVPLLLLLVMMVLDRNGRR